MEIAVTALPRSVPMSGARELIDEGGGAPLRCCLRDSHAGERLVLGLVTPPGPTGPYAETGPVFMHAEPCAGPANAGYPEEFRARRQVFRAYDAGGSIVGGEIVEPHDDQEEAAAALLARPEVAFLHSRNVIHGCYMFAIHTKE